MPDVDCVDEQDLRAFLLGQLPERVSQAVASHLEACPECEAAARRLDRQSDEMIRSLRRAAGHPAVNAATEIPSGPASVTPGAAVADALGPASLPRFIAGYEVLEELGRGGMSVVYKARQAHPNRLVALKVILAGGLADAERRARFLAEADAIARLRHPNIVQIYEVGRHAGLPYLALEHVEGGTLAQSLAAGTAQPARQAGELIEKLARAVQHAHECGVIHRDLKPTNILLAGDGTPKITDFGLAKQPRLELTTTGAVLGTPAYMAPEQAAGDTAAVGPASDVYTLGVILYELLTVRPPFQAATALETLEQVRCLEPVPPSRLQPKTPRDLETVCLKCLRKEPAQRYATAADLADDLRRFLDGRPIHARPLGWAGQLWRWCRRRPGVALLSASVVCLLLAIAAVSSLLAWRLGAEAERARAAGRNANERLFQSYLDQAKASRQSGHLGQRFASLDALRRAAGLARSLGYDAGRLRDLRNEAITCLALADLREAQRWPVAENRAWNGNAVQVHPLVAFDGGLRLYAWADDQGIVRVNQAADDREVFHLQAPPGPTGSTLPFLSPDGRFLGVNYFPFDAPFYTGWALIWDIRAGRRVRELTGANRACLLGFRPDSRAAVTGREDGSLHLHDLFGGEDRRFPVGLKADRMAFRPDGRRLACSSQDRPEVRVVDVETGAVVQSLAHPAELWALAWSPDGQLLATGCDDRKAYVWDCRDWHQQAALEGHHKPVTTVTFAPSGELLATGSTDGTTRLWDPISGTALVTAPGRCLGFDRDEHRLAFHEGLELGVWEVATGTACRQLHYGRLGNRTVAHSIASVEDVGFGARGRLLAACGNDGVRFWDVAGDGECGFLPLGRHETVLFDADGKRLVTYGRTGLRVWPIEAGAGDPPSTLRIGPPRRLPVPPHEGRLRACRDRDWRVLALADSGNQQVLLVDEARSSVTAVARGPRGVLDLSLSPDGRWLALSRRVEGVSIWDVAGNRALVPPPADMAAAGEGTAVFSPDGRWLVAGRQNDYRAWRVGHWDETPRLLPREHAGFWNGPLAFSPDGRLLALARTPLEIQLVDLTTFQEVARLLAPDARHILALCFSLDGGRLAAATENRIIQLWDLRAVGPVLRDMGLDEGLPSHPPDPVPAGGRLRLVLLPDTIEAENMPVLAQVKCKWDMRDTSGRKGAAWSNSRELFGAAEEGGYMELGLDVPRTGSYALSVTFTRGPDLGLVEVSLDNQRLGQPFDSYHEELVRSGKIDFGTLRLQEGRRRLRFTAVGKNPRATGYHLAVDCLELLPAERSPGK
jgi:WD40 repeat protein/tRNA A-37 threonylcarbamoyl transferase component Bud32